MMISPEELARCRRELEANGWIFLPPHQTP
jgi:hypothetical protein